MSSPARQLKTPPPRHTPTRSLETKRPLRSEAPRATERVTRRRSHHIGFAVLASALVASIVFGIVVLNVLLAQASFRIDEVERRIEALSADQVELAREQASLSAPGRIAHWASRHGMRLPDDIRILHPSGRTGVDPAGADPSSSETEATSP
jgi:cell division protein FtsL